MTENKTLPAFDSPEELADFFDANDMGDYELPEAEFEVDIQTREFLLPVDEVLMYKILRLAQEQGVSTPELVRGWLEEKVAAEV